MTPSDRVSVCPTSLPLVRWPTLRLKPNLSPRHPVVDEAYCHMLARLVDELPPIIVHVETGAIVDGVQRWSAYRRLGRSRIPGRAFSGSTADALVLGITLNLVCGKPFSRSERRRAISLILQSFPDRSDRWVAEVCGPSHTTVSEVRRAVDAMLDPDVPERRLGRDGRRRLVILSRSGRHEEDVDLTT